MTWSSCRSARLTGSAKGGHLESTPAPGRTPAVRCDLFRRRWPLHRLPGHEAVQLLRQAQSRPRSWVRRKASSLVPNLSLITNHCSEGSLTMIKVLGATVFGLLAVLGVGYFIIQKQEDQELKNQVDSALTNFGKTVKRTTGNVIEFFKGDPAPTPATPAEGVA